ncbi:uncharacterized protein LOC143291991 [Babylonia areolata]|uniref:uncharacterized protein LOC143291991 n=1 Tax=Babylonia areolata TaxID=304850 RepID=UPI003FD340C1
MVMEKVPIKYQLVRSLTWMDPRLLLNENSFQACISQLNLTLRIICDAGRVKEGDCDQIQTQFRRFRDSVLEGSSDAFRCFDLSSADELLYQCLSGCKEFSLLWELIQKMLPLSHGQDTVERGFSINKETMVENLKKRSLVFRRLIIDAVRRAGGPTKVPITKEMLSFASSARRRYDLYLEEEWTKQANKSKEAKRKAEAEEVEQLKAKRRRLQEVIDRLEAASAAEAEKAEQLAALSLLAQLNALRRRVSEKKEELANSDSILAEKSKAFKQQAI